MTNPNIILELQRIAQLSGGVLIADKVIEAAESESSILHGQFCWDDDKAAHQYRLEQARKLIRTTVRYIEINGDRRIDARFRFVDARSRKRWRRVSRYCGRNVRQRHAPTNA